MVEVGCGREIEPGPTGGLALGGDFGERPADPLDVRDRSTLLSHEQHSDTSVGHDVLQLARLEPSVDRHDDRPDQHRPEPCLEIHQGVRQQDSDPVAAAHTEPA